MCIHARLEASLAVGDRSIGRHGQHRQPIELQAIPDALGGPKTVQHRHLHIHEDHIKALWIDTQGLDRLQTVR
ncbi:hypothetical protein RZS08_20555, partial [Arthrospira platensis SPKY1]|nr:hypothetical protein [Arthrospira platensis SPKY1]